MNLSSTTRPIADSRHNNRTCSLPGLWQYLADSPVDMERPMSVTVLTAQQFQAQDFLFVQYLLLCCLLLPTANFKLRLVPLSPSLHKDRPDVVIVTP